MGWDNSFAVVACSDHNGKIIWQKNMYPLDAQGRADMNNVVQEQIGKANAQMIDANAMTMTYCRKCKMLIVPKS